MSNFITCTMNNPNQPHPPRLPQADDDLPVVPDPGPMASGQARRAWASQQHQPRRLEAVSRW